MSPSMLTHHAILVHLLHLHQQSDNTNESSVTVTDLPTSAQIPQGVPSFSAKGPHHSSELQGHVFTCVTSTNSVHLKPHQNLSSSFSQISLTDLRSQALDHLFILSELENSQTARVPALNLSSYLLPIMP